MKGRGRDDSIDVLGGADALRREIRQQETRRRSADERYIAAQTTQRIGDEIAQEDHQRMLPRLAATWSSNTAGAEFPQEALMYVSTSAICSSLSDG